MGVTVSPEHASWESAVGRLLRWEVRTRRSFDVALTLRSLTRAAPNGPWRVVFPLLLVARRGYLRALRQPAGGPG